MRPKNPAYVSPWPTLTGLGVIFASMFIDRTSAPAWLLWVSSLGVGVAWAFFFIRAERQNCAKADELELRIRAEGHSLSLHLSIAAALVFAPLQKSGLLHLELRHFCLILFVAYFAGPWIARRRYQ